MFTHINFDITSVKSRLSFLIFDFFFLDTNGSRRASKKRKFRERGLWLCFFTTEEVFREKYCRRRGLLRANYPVILHHVI